MLFGEANVGSDCIYLRKVFLGTSNTCKDDLEKLGLQAAV